MDGFESVSSTSNSNPPAEEVEIKEEWIGPQVYSLDHYKRGQMSTALKLIEIIDLTNEPENVRESNAAVEQQAANENVPNNRWSVHDSVAKKNVPPIIHRQTGKISVENYRRHRGARSGHPFSSTLVSENSISPQRQQMLTNEESAFYRIVSTEDTTIQQGDGANGTNDSEHSVVAMEVDESSASIDSAQEIQFIPEPMTTHEIIDASGNVVHLLHVIHSKEGFSKKKN